MIFPFESLDASSREVGLVLGLVIGVGFGFVLERSGFGRATKLAAQFYLRDMTVFKVMFTAIVTAMLGLVAAAGLGLTDLRATSELIVSWTYVWPMLIGGIVLGIGFIVSGYCPGTGLVSSASGNIDGMFAFGGVIAGTVLYSELQQIPAFQQFHLSSEKGAWFLYDLVKVPPQVLAVGFAVMALAAFAGAEVVERLVNSPERRVTVWKVAAAAFAAFGAVALLSLAVPKSTQAAPAEKPLAIAPSELARNVIAEPWRWRLEGDTAVDLSTGRALAITGGAAAWKSDPLVVSMTSGGGYVAPAPARPTGTFTKPKKKGGGCST